MGDVSRHKGVDTREALVIKRRPVVHNDKGPHTRQLRPRDIPPSLGLLFAVQNLVMEVYEDPEAASHNGQPANATDHAQVKNLHQNAS